MQLIKPSEVSGRIMTLIEESERSLVLVSPYVKIGKWYKLKNKINDAQNKNLSIEFYIRKDNENELSKNEVLSLGIIPIEIPNLHSKLYFNEKQAIITSMNLLTSSDINSLEIGYSTETKKEYDEIIDYYKRYIFVHKNITSTINNNSEANHWLDLIYDSLESTTKKLYIGLDDSEVKIDTGTNNYKVFLWNKKSMSYLRICGILSKKEFEIISNEIPAIEKNIGMKIDMQAGGKGYYDLIWGTSKDGFKSQNINEASKNEYSTISQLVYSFVTMIDKKKKEII